MMLDELEGDKNPWEKFKFVSKTLRGQRSNETLPCVRQANVFFLHFDTKWPTSCTLDILDMSVLVPIVDFEIFFELH